MRIGLFSPYLPKHRGGGEKHFLTSAWYLSKKHEVTIFVPTATRYLSKRISEYEELFGLDLAAVQWKKSPLADRTLNPLQTWWQTHKFDAFLYLTDGSLFISGARQNILHIQFPFDSAGGAWFQWKLSRWNVKNANSEFTRQQVEKSWHTKIDWVHYPYVQAPTSLPTNKQKIILSVGRFMDPQHNVGHSKYQELLIEAFAEGVRQHNWQGWELLLVGSVEPGLVHARHLQKLKEKAKHLPVKFFHGISNQQLIKLYQHSSLFWHAAGFGIDETQQPKKVEHFGMSTLEAMSYGCVPIVIKKGGLKEIVTANKNGFFFTTPPELVEKTQRVINSSRSQQQQWRQAAHERAQEFSLDRFCRTLEEMLNAS